MLFLSNFSEFYYQQITFILADSWTFLLHEL